MRTFKGKIHSLNENEIFVFGSNTQGRHGRGAAYVAHKQFGAEYGKPKGLWGQSYAIVTKDLRAKQKLRSVSLDEIENQVDEFLRFANHHKEWTFYVTQFGSSLAGYSMREIAELFEDKDIPDNIVMNENYAKILFESRMKDVLY